MSSRGGSGGAAGEADERLRELERDAELARESALDWFDTWDAMPADERRRRYQDDPKLLRDELRRQMNEANEALAHERVARGRAEGEARFNRQLRVFEALHRPPAHLLWTGRAVSNSVPPGMSRGGRANVFARFGPRNGVVDIWDVRFSGRVMREHQSIFVESIKLPNLYAVDGRPSNIRAAHESELTTALANLLERDIHACVQACTRSTAEIDFRCRSEARGSDPLYASTCFADILVCTEAENRPILVVETKAPNKLPPPGVVQERRRPTIFSCRDALNQLCTYMCAFNLQYGVLSSYAATWLVRLERCRGENLQCSVSRPFFGTLTEQPGGSLFHSSSQSSASVDTDAPPPPPPLDVESFRPEENPNGWTQAQALFFITLLAFANPHPPDPLWSRDQQRNALETAEQSSDRYRDINNTGGGRYSGRGDSTQRYPRRRLNGGADEPPRDSIAYLGWQLDRATRLIDRSVWQQLTDETKEQGSSFSMGLDFSEHKVMPALCASGLVLLDQQLDDGTPCVVKLLSQFNPVEFAQADLDTEVKTYAAVAALQGEVVPRVLYAGCDELDRLALVTTYEGETLHSQAGAEAALALGQQAFTTAALSALKRLHDAGWLHGDVAQRNLVIHPATHVVKLIDLGRAVHESTFAGAKRFATAKAAELTAMRDFIRAFFRPSTATIPVSPKRHCCAAQEAGRLDHFFDNEQHHTENKEGEKDKDMCP